MLLVSAGVLVATLIIPIPAPQQGTWDSPPYPAGYPDRFQQFHQAIRTGGDGTTYPHNYRVEELVRAQQARKHAGRFLDWKERGPGNVAGRTRVVAVDPSDSTNNTWYAGAISGGLWKSTNAGRGWVSLTDHLPNLAVSALAIPASDPSVIYMGTGEGFGNVDAVAGSGIFKSIDFGATWQQLGATATDEDFRFVNRLVVDPLDPDVVVAATNTGILRSVDGGNGWYKVYDASSKVQDLRAQPGNFNVLIATENGEAILRSDDAGATWTRTQEDFPNGGARMEIAFSPSDPNVVWAAIQISIETSDLIRSTDGGQTWTWTIPIQPNWMGPQGWYDNTLAVDPFEPDLVLLGGIQLWRAALRSDSSVVAGPSKVDLGQTEDFMDFVRFDKGTHFGRRLAVGTLNAAQDMTDADYVPIAIRFGQGSQKAHRFIVSETGGSSGDGGAGIALGDYTYADYVDVPLQVWDTESNRQLMFSFRDQADNGQWDLIARSVDPGTPRDQQSREYIFIHRYDYDDNAPHPSIADNGDVRYGMMYWMWPHLADEAVWDPGNLPATDIKISYARILAIEKSIRSWGQGAHVDHHALVTIPTNIPERKFWVLNGNDGGVAISYDNGRSYTEVDRMQGGYNTAQFYGIAKRPGMNVYIGGMQDNGTWMSADNPASRSGWHHELPGDGFDALWHASNDQLILASLQFNNIRRSYNGGATWDGAISGLGNVGDLNGGQFLTQLTNSPHDPDLVFTIGQSGVWKSDDFGATWDLTPVRSRWGFGDTGRIRASLASAEVVWAGYGMDTDGPTTLQVSRNGGGSFQWTTIPDISPEARLSGLATHPTEEGTAYALFSARSRPKVLRTGDFGQTWEDLSGFVPFGADVSTNGFPNVAVYDLLVLPHAPEVLWAGTEIGLFESRNHGYTWDYADNGLPAVPVWRMKVRDDQIVVATHGRGVWTVPADDIRTSAESPGTEMPLATALDQNYPNPFNASTTIAFGVPQRTLVQISVYDVTGRRLDVLADRWFEAGRHSVDWDAHGAASGVYFYRMAVDGNLVATRQLALVR